MAENTGPAEDQASKDAKPNERREQVLRAIAEGRLSVEVEWFGIARQACSVILQEGGGRLRAGDLLGLTARALHILFARDLLPRSKKHSNEHFALLEGVALELAIRALPSLVGLVGISDTPECDGGLEYRSKAWWFQWNAELNSNTIVDPGTPIAVARRIWNGVKGALIAPLDVQMIEAERGLRLSKLRPTIEQAEEMGERQQPDDPPSVADEVLGKLYELLEPGPSGNSELLFVGEDGMVRVSYRDVRDKVGEVSEQQLREAKLLLYLEDPIVSGREKEQAALGSTIASGEPGVLEAIGAVDNARQARELLGLLRSKLAEEEQRATGRADRLAARHFVDIKSKKVQLKEVAEREGISQSSLSEACKRMAQRLARDPRFRSAVDPPA